MTSASAGPGGWERRSLERSLAAARDRSSARAHRLVAGARELAAETGSSSFTVAEVAARAGVSLRSFYRHFSGKDDLLLALFEEETRQGSALLSAALGDGDPPLARLQAYVEGLCGLLVTGSGYASVLVREYLQLGERRPGELRSAVAPLLDLLEGELRSAAAAGEIRPVDRHDAVVVFSLILAHVHAALLFAPDEDRSAAAPRLWEFCLGALLPANQFPRDDERGP
ncbi:MAG: TetR/AcrR family transcriptional regulator [Acidimicrobiales bacterium]